MSQYPYPYGQPNGYQAHSPPYAAHPSYLPEGNQPAVDTAYHDASREAYEHNRSSIPGLAFGSSVPAGPSPSWPIQQAWQVPEYHNSAPAYHTSSYQPDHEPPRQQPTGTPGLELERRLSEPDNVREEGELSEDGELEDLYEPGTGYQPEARVDPPRESLDRSKESGQYSGEEGAPPEDGVGDLSAVLSAGRDRSGSYSPYLSPREIHPGSTPGDSLDGPSSVQPPPSAPSGIPSAPLTSGALGSVDSLSVGGPSLTPASPAIPPVIARMNPFSSLSEAKEKARDAIMSLVPLHLGYQTYVDEGIDETFVKGLFVELGLDFNSPQPHPLHLTPSPDRQSAAPPPPSLSLTIAKAEPSQLHPESAASVGAPSATPASNGEPSEERKDRIKRLLAQRAAQAQTGTAPTTAATKSSITSAQSDLALPSAAAPPASQKNLLLQQKMEALKQGRKEYSQTPTPAGPTQPPPKEVPQGETDLPAGVPIADVSLSGEATVRAADDGLPGPPSSMPQPLRNTRKRPVASDFTESSAAPPKRPFGQSRDKPFIIDVSDGSDDQDVEMDIGSPTDAPLQPATRPITSSSRTTSFRNHPPLSAPFGAHYSSPGPTTRTPPISQREVKADKELVQKEREIEELRKRIAQAEASKKLGAQKLSNASPLSSNTSRQSPARDIGGFGDLDPAEKQVTPADVSLSRLQSSELVTASGSERLPKPSDTRQNGNESKAARKLRITSHSLPAAEANLRAKMLKIRLLKSELARMEKEADEEYAEVARLNAEAEQLEEELAEDSDDRGSRIPSADAASIMSSDRAGDSSTSSSIAQRQVRGDSLQQPNNRLPASVDTIQVGNAHNLQIASPTAANEVLESGLNDQPTRETSGIASSAVSNAYSDDESPDVAMEEDSGPNSSEEGEVSDSYEPPAINAHSAATLSRDSMHSNLARAEELVPLEMSDTEVQATEPASPLPNQISAGAGDLDMSENVQVEHRPALPPHSDFQAYESALAYFHAYRFHPRYQDQVAGGLRSMTYSNKIDANLPVCPTELAGRVCPKGNDCEYQHFESMKVPDDQILLQLGSNNFEGEQKQRYINGLRDLLFDFRQRKIKDFQTIAQGIIDYRAKFNGDPMKILPLGDIAP